MKRVVVTGASGFTGGAMTAFLRQEGVETLSLTRSDFYSDDVHLPSEKAIAASLADFSPDTVFHFAGTSHTDRISDLYESNLLTTIALFSALKMRRLRPTVILCGSAAEYGVPSPDQLPISEKQVEHPRDEYGASKLAQTSLGRVYIAQGYPVIITRPFNLLGPRMPTRLAFGSFLDQITSSRASASCKLHVGNLDVSRDFILIQDAVRAWAQLAMIPAAIGKTINICSGEPTPLHALVDWLIDAARMPVKVIQEPKRERNADIAHHFGSKSILEGLIGWAPKPPTRTDVAKIVRDHLGTTSCPA